MDIIFLWTPLENRNILNAYNQCLILWNILRNSINLAGYLSYPWIQNSLFSNLFQQTNGIGGWTNHINVFWDISSTSGSTPEVKVHSFQFQTSFNPSSPFEVLDTVKPGRPPSNTWVGFSLIELIGKILGIQKTKNSRFIAITNMPTFSWTLEN